MIFIKNRIILFPLIRDKVSTAMQYTPAEKSLLENVNKIGSEMKPSDDDFIFIRLSPYLDHLMAFLKRLNSTEMQIVFMEYDGVMKVMRMMEICAQQMEEELGLRACPVFR